MSVKASQKAFISHNIKLDYFNYSNLKADIQHRISDSIEINFHKELGNIQGDDKRTKGTNLSELTLLAMAYFFESVFPKNTPIKDADYTVNSVKGFFDACNHTNYTAIYELDTTCLKLRDSVLFKACYLIIQSAWFFNSEHFGRHQHITYVNHYAETKKKLPQSQYKYDVDYLNKKYREIDEKNIKGVYGFKMVEECYHFILFLVVSELKLPADNFKISEKRFREYNPLVKCSRMLRGIAPFKIGECDIKSAFPSFIDFATNGENRHKVYSNLQEYYNISRSEAKILFNKWCNSGEYKSIQQTKDFLLTCGYSESECNIITSLTHCKDRLFYDIMCENEERYIDWFLKVNPNLNGARLHDGVLFIYKKEKPIQTVFDEKCVFGSKQLNTPVYTNSFGYSDKSLRFAFVSSVPPATSEEYKNLVRKRILTKPKVLGEANGFRFYGEKYEYITASFNLNQKYSFDEFIGNCLEMIISLRHLNEKPISKIQLLLILSHIRQNSNTVFNLRFLYRELLRHLNHKDSPTIRAKDYDFTENLTFRKKKDFTIALNTARGEVNKEVRLKHIFQTLENKISRNDFSFIDFKMKGKAKTNQLPKSILLRINKLSSGYERKPKAQKVNTNPLYISISKEGTSYLFEPHKYANKLRLTQRKIEKYEKDLIQFISLQTNQRKSLQYIHILGDLLAINPNTNVKRDEAVIKEEKKMIADAVGSKTFKSLCKKTKANKVKAITPSNDDFDTSMEHSAFNIEIEEAHNRGQQFFDEYLKFHKLDETQKEVKEIKTKKEEITFPEFDFDE